MYYFLNKIIISLVSILPEFFVKIFANKYVAGTKTSEALKVVKKLNSKKLSCTLDILGEHTTVLDNSNAITNKYLDILNNIKSNNLDCNISIKLSHIGSDIDFKNFNQNIKKLITTAEKNNNFIRLDMEDSKLTDLSINTYKNNINYKQHLGIALQAYLLRSENDLKSLEENTNIRLCKGIYNEDKSIAIKDPELINKNYIHLLNMALDKKIYVGIATHDEKLINNSVEIIKNKNIDKNKFEFQMLYGVPMNKTVKYLLKNKFKVRIYVPYGRNWYDYSIRRLKENPNISKYIIQNLFK
jgi:proline dehydrogenase